MKRGIGIVAAIIAAYVLASAGLALHIRYSPSADPHVSLRDPARCPTCHMEERPERGRPYRLMNFRKDIYTLCTGCHAAPVTHPIDIAPRRGITGNLPLDSDGTMTCVTCHAPHAPALSTRRYVGRTLPEKLRDTAFPFLSERKRTALLRVPNTDGQLCEMCHAGESLHAGPHTGKRSTAGYSGSRSCGRCHVAEYAEWKRSPHARMVRSPGRNAGAVLAKFEGSSPFPPSEIAYVLGSRTVQRFVSRKGNTLVVRTPIWIVRSGTWNLDYWREQDWSKSCAGCHVTGYDPVLPAFAEEGIGCEACHGPGRAHAATGRRVDIVHPGRLPAARRAMICESCHTTGHDSTGEYRFPVGYLPGENLSKYFFGMVPKPGQDDSTYKGDGSIADRHSQFRFWASRMLIVEGETCDLCKNFRNGPGGNVPRREPKKMSSSDFCRSCHGGNSLLLPRHHGDTAVTRSKGCHSCHPVRRTPGGAPSVHDHKYLPDGALAESDAPAAFDSSSRCFVCHPAPSKGV